MNLREGMIVHSADGDRMGKIVSIRADGFIIEKGLFLPKATMFRYDDIAGIRGDDIYLAHQRAQLSDPGWWNRREQAISARLSGMPTRQDVAPTTTQATMQPTSRPAVQTKPESYGIAPSIEGTPDEIRVPLVEEEITAEKRTRNIGEVRVHKHVVVKQKQITVPVMHEEIRVERVQVEPTSSRTPTEGAFVESTVSIPLHDEEVEIHKRAVVREEVRLTRQTFQEERTATTEVRKEEIDIEEPPGARGHLRAPAH
jgi:uncharacterized protein (TIGR02271 family)